MTVSDNIIRIPWIIWPNNKNVRWEVVICKASFIFLENVSFQVETRIGKWEQNHLGPKFQ